MTLMNNKKTTRESSFRAYWCLIFLDKFREYLVDMPELTYFFGFDKQYEKIEIEVNFIARESSKNIN